MINDLPVFIPIKSSDIKHVVKHRHIDHKFIRNDTMNVEVKLEILSPKPQVFLLFML